MKKKISLLFLLIPLMCFPLINVGAGNNEGKELRTITKKEPHYEYKIKINDANNQEIHHGSLYEIELENEVALCLDPNQPISRGAKYHMVGKIMNDGSQANTLLIKAYLYAIANKSNMQARAAAQIVAWKWGKYEYTQGIDEEALIQSARNDTLEMKIGTLLRTFRDGLRDFAPNASTQREKNIKAALIAIKELANILRTDIPSDLEYLGIWQDVNTPKNQRVLALSDQKAEEELEKEDCKQVTFNALMPCYGDGNYTFGSVYQGTVGQCKNYYDLKKKNNYSTYGVKDVDIGTYCRVYCNKSYGQTLPGNIAKSINVGRYIVWPNNNIENNRYKVNSNLAQFPMELSLTKTCRIGVAYDDDKKNFNVNIDYQTALKNYNTYINSIRDVYNKYRADGRVCTWFENDYKAKKDAADNYCNNEVGSEPSPSHVDVPYPCCKKTDAKGKCTSIGVCTSSVETPDHIAWRGRVDHCNSLKTIANEALTKLNQCNAIQNYVDAVANVIKDFNHCVNYKASINLNFSVPGISASFDDDEYGKTMGLKETYVKKTCTNCTSTIGVLPEINKYNVETNILSTVNAKANAVKSRTIIGETRKKYDLANGYYYFVDKDTNKSVDSYAGIKNYSIIGFSNMPISYNANPKKTYNLGIHITSITGDANVFNKEITSNNYVCHYKVTKTTSGSCICPEGTKHAGESLDCLSKNNNGTCLDNQEQYCNSDQEIPHSCSSDDLTCPSDPSMDLSSCVNAGKTYDWCANQFCNSGTPGNQRWVCPSGTNEGMDLSSCVIPMIIKGYSERDAYNYCKDVTCPYKGIKIIYRVIDLTNPFPSKDADSIVTQRDLRVGMFNDELKGRYPGANWNSTTVVKNKILNNRGKDGDKVYDKEPLYTFIVDTSNIKEIRKYNNAQRESYSDFKLNCLDGRTACKSDFVHNSIYGLKGGTCKNVSKGNFYTCAS